MDESHDSMISAYLAVTGKGVIDHLRQLATHLQGAKVVHVNSTREGGGVAEILEKLIPLKRAFGIDARWDVITGGEEFYRSTKAFHNGLQGEHPRLTEAMLTAYEKTNAENSERIRDLVKDADFVFIHDPQPAPLLSHCPDRRGKWIWRCHIDARHPHRATWKYLKKWVSPYDASIFSLPEFAQKLPHPQYIIAPSIDPLSEKNRELPDEEIRSVYDRFSLDPELPMILQVSRYDRFKDPVGVIEAYRHARKLTPLQLVLAGGGATDDPEGEAVLKEVHQAANGDPDIHILLLPATAHRTINALQRASDIVLQKSTREGFGLTVTEAMWKGKPVIGGDTGGIRLQVIDHQTGFLVQTPEGAALRIRYLLHRRDTLYKMGERARNFVRDNFLLTRHLREHMTLMLGLEGRGVERIEAGG